MEEVEVKEVDEVEIEEEEVDEEETEIVDEEDEVEEEEEDKQEEEPMLLEITMDLLRSLLKMIVLSLPLVDSENKLS